VYQPSGRFDPARLPQALALLAAVAVGIAVGYYAMLIGGVYISAMSVFWPVLAATGATWAAVKRCHCRNRALAGTLGLVCGLTAYLGYFHLDQCRRWAVPWTAVARLPNYVVFRMETDQWQLAGKGAFLRPQPPAPGVLPFRPLANIRWRSWNWAGFFFELLTLAIASAVTGGAAAAEPYSEKRRRWCSRESLILAPEAGQGLRAALAERTVGAWTEAGPRKVGAHQPHCKVTLWYTPASVGEEPEVEAFLSFGKEKPLRLSPEEAAAFVELLPAVQDVAGPSLQQLAAEADGENDPASARVWPVPSPYAGQVGNRWNQLKCRILGMSLLVLPLPVVGLVLVGGTALLHELAVRQNVLPGWVVISYVIGAGAFCLGFSVWWFRPERIMPIVQQVRLSAWLTRRAVAGRPSPLVAAADPWAVYAEMAPRRLWEAGRAKCGEVNAGLLLADGARRVLLFEGDYERYWIPADAILACDVEALTGMAATTTALYAVVVRVRLGSGTWEFPFFPLAGIEGRNNWERALALLGRVEQVCGRRFSSPPPAPPRDRGPVIV
jgi:hypothetical protein